MGIVKVAYMYTAIYPAFWGRNTNMQNQRLLLDPPLVIHVLSADTDVSGLIAPCVVYICDVRGDLLVFSESVK